MSLDSKLREILQSKRALHFSKGEDDPWRPMTDDNCIAQIKQVFAYEGYIDAKTFTALPQLDFLKEHLDNKHMTGEEFHDRFVKEAKRMKRNKKPFNAKNVYEAVRKAAGLDT